MHSGTWKAWERRVAEILGGVRRGPDTRGEHGGKTDIIHDRFAIECKRLSRPSFGLILDACKQAEKNGEDWQEPIAVVGRKQDCWKDAIVVMRLEVFKKWRAGDWEISSEVPESSQEGISNET